MTKKQKQAVLESIARDATLRWHYALEADGKIDCCVIGGLALHAGMKLEKIRAANQAFVHHRDVGFTDFLETHYGLTLEQLKDLQCINDSYTDDQLNERRAALTEYVERQPTD